ncbi:MAG: hypothetical protein LBG29_04995, partial [Synergistaceae bacterium]|nr:hypothetical protein [Synergistaceae bacterium]
MVFTDALLNGAIQSSTDGRTDGRTAFGASLPTLLHACLAHNPRRTGSTSPVAHSAILRIAGKSAPNAPVGREFSKIGSRLPRSRSSAYYQYASGRSLGNPSHCRQIH